MWHLVILLMISHKLTIHHIYMLIIENTVNYNMSKHKHKDNGDGGHKDLQQLKPFGRHSSI